MRYYSKSQMQAMEHQAVERGISMEDLMEYAGGAAAQFIQRKYTLEEKRVTILCGKGNNGGDGYVVARILQKTGAYVTVVLAEGMPATALARQAFDKMEPEIVVTDWEQENRAARQAITGADLLVDGLYGFGFRGTMPENMGVLAELANRCRVPIISLDIASGVECDTGAVRGPCIKAWYTTAFTAAKPGHVLYPGKEYCGEVAVLPAGIPPEIPAQTVPVLETVEMRWVKEQFHPRHSESNKGDYGKLLCICGSEGMAGAAIMSGWAALRCGAGLVNLALPRAIYPIAAGRLLESVFTILDRENGVLTQDSEERLDKALKSASACVIGCGLGMESTFLVKKVLEEAECPVILDADGLNSVCGHLDWLKEAALKKPVIVTPHPGEMARLLGATIKEVQANRLSAADFLAREYGVVTVLKGAGTLIALPSGRCYINHTGNPGMARGGSGDILAGMIGSFAAQGMEASAAARAGVYLHGLAGDRSARKHSQQGMLPTDMIEEIPRIFLDM